MFYDRLSSCCKAKGIKINALADKFGTSKGTISGWKNGTSPNSSFVVKAAELFGVSTDYLLGITDDPTSKIESGWMLLEKPEIDLVKKLRSSTDETAKSVYKMAAAVLSAPPIRAEESSAPAFSSPKGETRHVHTPRRKPMKRVEGEAAAGLPIEAVPEDEDAMIPVPAKYLADRYFIVRARGDSMTGSGIEDGAYCVFDSEASFDEGDVVLAIVDGSTDRADGAIKRAFSVSGDDPDGDDAMVELRSTNPAYAPMRYPADEVRIAGVWVDVLPSGETA